MEMYIDEYINCIFEYKYLEINLAKNIETLKIVNKSLMTFIKVIRNFYKDYKKIIFYTFLFCLFSSP